MTAEMILDQINQLENHEKNKLLDRIYDDYFDKGIPMKILMEHARILEMYYDGELVRTDEYDYES